MGSSARKLSLGLLVGLLVFVHSACSKSSSSRTQDLAPPTATIETPTTAPTYDTTTTPVTLGGTAADDRSVESVTWDNGATGQSGTATGTTSWTATVDLAFGANDITVTAHDVAGRTGSASITVTFDPADPTVEIDTPTLLPFDGTLATPVSLGGTATDPIGVASVGWSNAATGATGTATGTTTWTAAVPLSRGANPITVTATDNRGATGSDSITVTLSLGEAYGWGNNARGQVGDDSTTARHFTPTQVVDPSDPSGFLTNVVAAAGGGVFSAALIGDGTVRAWGENGLGQLGDGSTQDTSVPVQVIDPGDVSGYLTGVAALASGSRHTLALIGDGTVRAWGYDTHGQLGDGLGGGYSSTLVQVIDPGDLTGFLTGVTAVAGGNGHSLALISDGTVRAWGLNSNGELGDDSLMPSPTPIQVTDPADPTGFLQGVVAIAAGGSGTTFSGWSVALIGDGTLRAWGDNGSGQLGDGTMTGRLTPVTVTDPGDPTGNLTSVAAIAAWGRHTLALKTDGTLRGFGENNDGELGDGTGTNSTTPVRVRDPQDPTGFLTGVSAIAAGGFQTMALLGDGTIRASGNNFYGEVGDGTGVDQWTPVQVIDPTDPTGNLTNVAAIACGAWHGLAVIGDGTLRAWGRNWEGQIGDGSGLFSATPVRVADPLDPSGLLQSVIGIGAGSNHSLGLIDDRTARSWGMNWYGELGDTTTTDRSSAVQVVDPFDPTGFLTDAAVLTGGGSRSFALLHDGTVRAWGFGGYGGLGDNTGAGRTSPVQVVDLNDPSSYLTWVEAISAGTYHTAALIADGTLRTWGSNWHGGELGDGTFMDRLSAVQVVDPADPTGFLQGAVAVAAGDGHTLALLGDGTVRAWGDNTQGQLGDGSNNGSPDPVQVVDPGDPSGFLTGIIAISSRWDSSFALKVDGTVRAWGENGSGQLGNGSRMPTNTPVQVIDLTDPTGFLRGVTIIAAGGFHTVALLDDGTLRAWGRNIHGQLGDGSTLTSPEPVQVLDPTDLTGFLTEVTAIAAGYEHTLALK